MPATGGLVIGVFAIWFPEILGVGYEATNKALNEDYGFSALLTLLMMKLIATIVCLGSGFVGGVFSPSLFMGAMLGGAFGIIVAWPFPELASSLGSYSITGMGASVLSTMWHKLKIYNPFYTQTYQPLSSGQYFPLVSNQETVNLYWYTS